MLPEHELPVRIFGTKAFIDFLGPQDEPWLRVLVREMQRFEGRRWHELAERLADPLSCEAPHFKRRCATRVLARLWRRDRVTAVPPIEARARLFQAAAASTAPAAEVIAATASSFEITPEALSNALLGDLPRERRVRAPVPTPEPGELVLRINLAVVQAVLMRASAVDLRLRGAARPIVRLAKLHGLLCVLRLSERDLDPVLEISGPFSIFRHTLLYGRALAALLPHLAWCARFELKASVALRGRLVDVGVESGAPIYPAAPPSAFDSRLEERFARDFERIAPDWHLIREPEPLRAGNTLIFPDFLLQHRIHAERRVLVEVVGFWTPEYLATKLARLRGSGATNLIVCIDDRRGCGNEGHAASWPVIRFRRWIDAEEVLRAAEGMPWRS